MPRNGCITSVRFMMICDIVSPHVEASPGTVTGGEGHWEWKQDEESGAIIQEWVKDDPNTTSIEGTVIKDVPVFAEGILDGGIRVAGTTERFSTLYESVDFVKAIFPKDVMLSRKDRVTNIRNRQSGEVLWREEEIFDAPATIFNVMGVTPVLFLGKIIEKSVLLERSQVQ